MEPFRQDSSVFMHGSTYDGHPVASAVALENLDIIEREDIYQHVLSNKEAFKSTLDKLRDLPIIGDLRGTGFFYGIELVKDKAAKTSFTAEESERILEGYVSTTPVRQRPDTAAPTTAPNQWSRSHRR